MTNWTDIGGADMSVVTYEIVRGLRERILVTPAAALFPSYIPALPTKGTDIQDTAFWEPLYDWIYYLSELSRYFVDHTLADGSGVLANTYFHDPDSGELRIQRISEGDESSSWENWFSKAGLSLDGVRYATEWPTDWTDFEDPAFTYRAPTSGTHQPKGAIIGPWVFYDWQRLLDVLRWTEFGEGNRDNEEVNWGSFTSHHFKAWADYAALQADPTFTLVSGAGGYEFPHRVVKRWTGDTREGHVTRGTMSLAANPAGVQDYIDFYARGGVAFPSEVDLDIEQDTMGDSDVGALVQGEHRRLVADSGPSSASRTLTYPNTDSPFTVPAEWTLYKFAGWKMRESVGVRKHQFTNQGFA